MGARDYEQALCLSDKLLAEAQGFHTSRWACFRGALHRHRNEFDLAKEWLIIAFQRVMEARQRGPVSQEYLCILALHLNLCGLVDLALNVVAAIDEPEPRAIGDIGACRRRLSDALKLSEAVRSTPWRIVPVGQECLPFELATRWGLGGLVLEGPFTAGVFFGDGPSLAIEDHFRNFVDPAALRVSKLPSGVEAPTVPAYGALLNHEAGPYWCADDFARLRHLYRERVARFESATSGSNILFVLDRRYAIDLDRLLRVLWQAVGGRAHRLLVIGPDLPGDAVDQDGRVIHAKVDRPREKYVWHEASSYNSTRGYEYERQIISALVAAVD